MADLRPPRSKADLCVKRSERLLGAHPGPVDFVLRALAARKLLRQSKFLHRCAARKQVIHTHHSKVEIIKGLQGKPITKSSGDLSNRVSFRFIAAKFAIPVHSSGAAHNDQRANGRKSPRITQLCRMPRIAGLASQPFMRAAAIGSKWLCPPDSVLRRMSAIGVISLVI